MTSQVNVYTRLTLVSFSCSINKLAVSYKGRDAAQTTQNVRTWAFSVYFNGSWVMGMLF